MRMIFSTVLGPHEPALTVGSLAMTLTGRPPIVPLPVTTPSAPRPSSCQLASRPSSTNEPSSSSRATRSRTGSLPCSAALTRWLLLVVEADLAAQLLHAPLELHEGLAEALDLVGVQRAALDAPDGLALHQLADEVDEHEHEPGEALLDVLGIGVDARGHGVGKE